VTADGPVYAELEISYELDLPAALEQDRRGRSSRTVACPAVTRVRVAAGVDRVEFTTSVANRAADHRLRVRFLCPEPVDAVRAEGHFAVVRRPSRPAWNGSWFEPPHDTNHTLGAVAAGGLVLIDKGLPEYEVTEGGELALTLLRCVGWLSRADLSTRRGSAGPELPVPEAQCPGDHVFEYALELGAPPDAELLRRSQDYRFDFVEGAPAVELEPPFEVQGDLVFSALKAAEDREGTILRVFNAGDADAELPLPEDAERCRLDERALANRAPIRAGEIAGFRLRTPV